MSAAYRETILFGKPYIWDQTDPNRAVLLNPRNLPAVKEALSSIVEGVREALSTMSTPAREGQEGAEAGNKPLNGGPSGGRA